MDIRQITPDYAVSPQIDPADLAEIAAQGFRTVICNRPDGENPVDLQASVMAEAAAAAGLNFVVHPVVHTALTPDVIDTQRSAIEAGPGPVLAYCASGTRSTIVWMLGQAGSLPSDQLIALAAGAGYQLAHLKPHLDALAGDDG